LLADQGEIQREIRDTDTQTSIEVPAK
jgi:hypothetical protein